MPESRTDQQDRSINGEAIELETIVFAAAVVATVMIGRRMPIRR